MAKLYGMMRVGKDADIRTTGNDTVVNLSLAYNYGRKPQDGGHQPSQWIDAAFWGDRAARVAPWLTKGSQHCFTISDVHIQEYTTRDGGVGYKLAGRVDDVELGAKLTTAAPAPQRQQAPAPRQAPKAQSSGFDDMDNSIPF